MKQTTSSKMRNGLLLEAVNWMHLHHLLCHHCQHGKLHKQMIEDRSSTFFTCYAFLVALMEATALEMSTKVCASATHIYCQITNNSRPSSIACISTKSTQTRLFSTISLLQDIIEQRQRNEINETTLHCVENYLRIRGSIKFYHACNTYIELAGVIETNKNTVDEELTSDMEDEDKINANQEKVKRMKRGIHKTFMLDIADYISIPWITKQQYLIDPTSFL
eukprot:889779-Ditylum_brightwellii.AAC.1